MAATRALRSWWARLFALLSGLAGGVFATLTATQPARAAELPEDTAEAFLHGYHGGGVDAYGPAVLVRKSLFDKVSIGATYYMDAVSNASIDVVTTASKYHETRHEFGLTADYVYRDARITLGGSTSREPDYIANAGSVDIAQDVFSGLTTVSLGFTRGDDTVKKKDSPEFRDKAKHWQYRLGLTQVLTPTWVASLNLESTSDTGYLGSPYRIARVFGAAVPENVPRTRTGQAVRLRAIGAIGAADSVSVAYRYFRDTWKIQAHTVDLGYSRHFGESWIGDLTARWYSQSKASFYSDDATTETTYVSRNRQLGDFDDWSLGARATWTARKVPGRYELKLVGSYEYQRYSFSDFTDIRSGDKYRYGAHIAQIALTATF